MALWILRGVFLVITIGIGLVASSEFVVPPISVTDEAGVVTEAVQGSGFTQWVVFLVFLVGAIATVACDVLIREKRIDMISSVYFGLVVGLVLTLVVDFALAPFFGLQMEVVLDGARVETGTLRMLIRSFVGLVLCYTCVSMLWQTRDDFRFLIPYVEFSKDVKGSKPYILDTSVVIDGRIADVIETGIIDNQLIMPRFVLAELQAIADSSDKMRRSRGRRGLDILDRLRNNKEIDFKVYDRETPDMQGQPVDMKLLLLARHLDGKVVTGDFNLNKVAKLQNVPVINLNEIANSLKPVFLPGEKIKVRVVKLGEGPGQGIGYLDDGTMIVIEDGRSHVGNDVHIVVTSMLQTSAGRMVFGKFEHEV